MKIAVPAWEGRISPVFDTARHILCFDVENGVGRPAGETEVSSGDPQAKLKRLQELGVNVLICGAVSRPFATMLSGMGIRLVPFLAGDVEQIVNAFAVGKLEGVRFHMPGCCGIARRHRGGRCAGKGESQS